MIKNDMVFPNLSIVALCYRTENFAREFTKETIALLEKARIDYELILVGNYISGSGDRTPDVIAELAQEYPKIVAIARPKEGMMGWDMRSGIKAARGEYIAVIDGDGQLFSWDLLKIYDMIKTGDFDLCKTYRIRREDGICRLLLSKVYNFVFSIMFYPNPIRDVNSKPKIMTRAAYDKLALINNGWFIDAEMMIKPKRLGFRIGEIPTVFKKNPRRKTFINTQAILEFIKNMVIYRVKSGI